MILVFGKTGQVGCELARHTDVLCLDRAEADLSQPASCAEAIRKHQPAAVINAAAFTAVDRAEKEEAEATIVNGDAPGAMAAACAALDIPLVQISTDYVFDGSGDAPWQPDDATSPLGAYGRSKLLGEQAVMQQGGCYAILRTSWVVSPHGKNFVKTMLRLGKERDGLTIVSDQIGAPTPARDIAAACVEIARHLIQDPGKTGIYHYSGTPEINWADFAREIFAQTGRGCPVTDILTRDYPTPARRPLNSRLDCSATERVFGLTRPDWRQGLTSILEELGEI
ncbi:dTDP-4-dehydrorhamnose reductase [Ruegeria sp.]|uniref:dTDP-4-dehydrorhamnose reductase n=1 Tax=Ruegeria sp. TaxID=1879320 RepID=UPI002326637C|nr:dTDP-4-dehydrorhamnose reductase [Ruegeria sp.]MDA7965961.1 dTDP-4-dehydrorhamnose reductase [Ruegeria sp.]